MGEPVEWQPVRFSRISIMFESSPDTAPLFCSTLPKWFDSPKIVAHDPCYLAHCSVLCFNCFSFFMLSVINKYVPLGPTMGRGLNKNRI